MSREELVLPVRVSLVMRCQRIKGAAPENVPGSRRTALMAQGSAAGGDRDVHLCLPVPWRFRTLKPAFVRCGEHSAV